MTDPDLSTLIHDLRNPLNSIAMTAELARLQIQQGAATAKVVENLDAILRLCQDCGARLDGYSARAGAQDRPGAGEPAENDGARGEG